MKSKSMKWAMLCALAVLAGNVWAAGPNAVTGDISALNANLSSGTATTNSSVAMALHTGSRWGNLFSGSNPTYAFVTAAVSGTFSATLTFQGSYDEGSNWVTISQAMAIPVTGTVVVSTTTTTGGWLLPVAGMTNVRVTCSSYTSGTATVLLNGTSTPLYPVMPLLDASRRLLHGNSATSTYGMTAAITVPTAAQSLFALEASATTKVRLRSLKLCLLTGIQTTAGERQFVLFHTTAASTGGTAATPILWDKSQSAFGGITRHGGITTTPAIGSVTVANALWGFVMHVPAAATTNVLCVEKNFEGVARPPTIAAGVANGLALGDITGGTGGTGDYSLSVEFTEESN